jgi:hypothetical protein
MRGETSAAPARLGRMEDRKSSNSNASRVATDVRSARNCAADNKRNVLLRCGHPSSSPRRSLPRVSARDVVAGVVAAQDAEKLALRQRLAHRQQRIRIRVRRNGHRARLGLRVRRKQEPKAARRAPWMAVHRAPTVTAARSGEDVSGGAGRVVVTVVDRRADRLLRNRAGLPD